MATIAGRRASAPLDPVDAVLIRRFGGPECASGFPLVVLENPPYELGQTIRVDRGRRELHVVTDHHGAEVTAEVVPVLSGADGRYILTEFLRVDGAPL